MNFKLTEHQHYELDSASTQKRTGILHNAIVHKGCSGIVHLLAV